MCFIRNRTFTISKEKEKYLFSYKIAYSFDKEQIYLICYYSKKMNYYYIFKDINNNIKKRDRAREEKKRIKTFFMQQF